MKDYIITSLVVLASVVSITICIHVNVEHEKHCERALYTAMLQHRGMPKDCHNYF